jgi:hypothetical protein
MTAGKVTAAANQAGEWLKKLKMGNLKWPGGCDRIARFDPG